MFVWNFNAIIAIFFLLLLVLVFIIWVAYTLNKASEKDASGLTECFRQCGYCGHVYLDYKKRNPPRCVRCLSYHDI